ncbi:hypothetical protein Ancab_038436 [Ancistrocladus abbreviatus]
MTGHVDRPPCAIRPIWIKMEKLDRGGGDKEAVRLPVEAEVLQLEGSPCNSHFASLEKENVHGQAQFQPSPRSNDYRLCTFDVVQPYSRKRLATLRMIGCDIRAIIRETFEGCIYRRHERFSREVGGSKSSGEDDGPNSLKVSRALERSEPSSFKEKHAKPIMGQGLKSKASEGRPNIVGLKKKKTPKIPKKAKKKMTSPVEKG